MYREDNAIENLDYICYSSPMVGEDVFTYVCDNYGLTTLIPCNEETDYQDANGNYYEEIYVANAPDFDTSLSTYRVAYLDDTNHLAYEDVEFFGYSVKHFFKDKISGDGVIYTDSRKRQLAAMYPEESTMNRCVVMEHVETDRLKKLNNMWDSVKVGYMPYSTMLAITISALVVLGLIITFIILKKKGVSIHLPKKNLGTLIKSERIK
jgi:hypothetical protein